MVWRSTTDGRWERREGEGDWSLSRMSERVTPLTDGNGHLKGHLGSSPREMGILVPVPERSRNPQSKPAHPGGRSMGLR